MQARPAGGSSRASLKFFLGPSGKRLDVRKKLIGLSLGLYPRPVLDLLLLPEDAAEPRLLCERKPISECVSQVLHRRCVVLAVYSSRMTGSQRVGVGYDGIRSEEHTSELQSLMRITYAVFCLKNKKKNYST